MYGYWWQVSHLDKVLTCSIAETGASRYPWMGRAFAIVDKRTGQEVAPGGVCGEEEIPNYMECRSKLAS